MKDNFGMLPTNLKNMKPFFAYSHLGTSIKQWEEFLSSHKRIMSNYDATIKKSYINGNLEDKTPNPQKWFFSKGKWFDIILHNHQIGYKNFYSMYPSILIYSFKKDVLKNIKSNKLYNKKFAEIYLNMRVQRLNYICNMAVKPLVFVEGLSSMDVMRECLCNYLDIPHEFEDVPEFEKYLDCSHENLNWLKGMHESGKIILAI